MTKWNTNGTKAKGNSKEINITKDKFTNLFFLLFWRRLFGRWRWLLLCLLQNNFYSTKQSYVADFAPERNPRWVGLVVGPYHHNKFGWDQRSSFGCYIIISPLTIHSDLSYGPLCRNMMRSTKLEVHNISQCRHSRSKTQMQLTYTEFAQLKKMWFLRYTSKQTNINTK